MSDKGVCRHCSTRKVSNQSGRGLCLICHRDKDIRITYSVNSSRSHRGVGFHEISAAKEWSPTPELPGTEGKMRVLEYRASKGLPLWHPQDASI